MEEVEVPMEHLHEEINEKAEELVRKSENKWILFVAISTALMAVLAALASLFAGHHSNEALIMQIKASDQWNYYQAKSIKAEIRKLEPQTVDISKTPEVVNKEEESVKSTAEDDEKESKAHLQRHVTLATAVTFLQVAIAVSAISIITRRRFLWYGAMAVAVIGGYFFIMGLV
jgi:alpha-galactosidase/6-phospho-beta-glucosidase family protein